MLFSNRKLKDFRLQCLFLREDLSPDHKVRQWKSRSKSTLENQSVSAGASTSESSRSRDIAESSNVPLPMCQEVSPSVSGSSVNQIDHCSGEEDLRLMCLTIHHPSSLQVCLLHHLT